MKQTNKILWSLFFTIFMMNTLVAQEFEGYALYNSLSSKNAYLIDANGDIAHTWACTHSGNYAVLLKDNGNIIRGAIYDGNVLQGAAVGGRVQEVDPEGNLVWDYIYSGPEYVQHHDITLMPNGGVLLTAWEVMTGAELEAMGYTGNSNQKWPTHFVEIQQDGTVGKIVWEWHIKDHFVQDVNPSLDNYGSISEHPELMNINVEAGGFGGFGGDWFHVNGVNYDPVMDQIVFSSRFLSEIFVIDHSTTTEEAASHQGGNSGMGGDLLYRWGNPSNYDTPGNQTIPGPVHDARFIPEDGRPRSGHIQYFSNDGGTKSSVEAILPPRDGFLFTKEEKVAYGPIAPSYIHNTLEYAWGQSASNTMPNGNTFVNMSGEYMYEVDMNDEVIWQYGEGPAKAFRYTCDHPGIKALLGESACSGVSTEDIVIADIVVSPNPSYGIINISGDDRSMIRNVICHDLIGQEVTRFPFNGNIDLTGLNEGMYILTFLLDDDYRMTKKISILK